MDLCTDGCQLFSISSRGTPRHIYGGILQRLSNIFSILGRFIHDLDVFLPLVVLVDPGFEVLRRLVHLSSPRVQLVAKAFVLLDLGFDLFSFLLDLSLLISNLSGPLLQLTLIENWLMGLGLRILTIDPVLVMHYNESSR